MLSEVLPSFCFAVSLLALNEQTFPKVTVVLDSTIQSAEVPLALRASSTSSTVFLSGQDIVSYLKKLETKDATIQEIDFEALKVVAPAPSAARIEGAPQIAIGIKKEVDFAGWYTNVSHPDFIDTKKPPKADDSTDYPGILGLDQGGYA